MKTKMIQEMTTEERMALQSEMEAFTPKLKRLEHVANAQSHTMAWTPACGNYLPEGLMILCHFKDSKPYAEDALANKKTSEATKEFIVFWNLAKEQLDFILSENENGSELEEAEISSEEKEQVSNKVPDSETEESDDVQPKKNGLQTRRGRK